MRHGFFVFYFFSKYKRSFLQRWQLIFRSDSPPKKELPVERWEGGVFFPRLQCDCARLRNQGMRNAFMTEKNKAFFAPTANLSIYVKRPKTQLRHVAFQEPQPTQATRYRAVLVSLRNGCHEESGWKMEGCAVVWLLGWRLVSSGWLLVKSYGKGGLESNQEEVGSEGRIWWVAYPWSASAPQHW